MKKQFLNLLSLKVVLVTILVLSTTSLFAQEKKRTMEVLTSKESAEKVENSLPSKSELMGMLQGHSIGIGLGQTFLKGGFEKLGDNQISLDLYYNYKASYSFDFIGNIHRSAHTYKSQEAIVQGLALGVKGKFYQYDAFTPFALGGLGFYTPRVVRTINNESLESETKATIGFHFGLGGDLELNRHFTTSLIFHYHNPFDIKQENGPDVKGSYYKVLIALYYNF